MGSLLSDESVNDMQKVYVYDDFMIIMMNGCCADIACVANM